MTDAPTVRDRARAARRAGARLAAAAAADRDRILHALADLLRAGDVRAKVLEANAADLADARAAQARGELSAALVARLELSDAKLDGLADAAAQLAGAPDPLGRVDLRRRLDAGLVLERESVPLGVLAVVFESRPDAVVQIGALCLRTGNAVLLKGGSEARRSNAVLVEVLRRAVAEAGLDPAAVVNLPDREAFAEVLGLSDLVDLVVARGSSAFVAKVREATRIPVVGHAAGLCHVVLCAPCDPAMAVDVVEDAKCSYPAACNAVETLLWTVGAEAALAAVVERLRERGVRLLGCGRTRALHPDLEPATEADWDAEYGDLVLSIRGVGDLDAALAHVAAHGSGHTEAIVTDDPVAAERFLREVDAAGVFHNASTRFADGYRYGFGAEIGISTGKLHARGPVGIEGLLSRRYRLRGAGHVASAYGPGKRAFLHEDLPVDDP